jgi:hypothetical protein
VWALGSLYFTMLTNTYVFNAGSMRELKLKLKLGTWKWPKDVMFSL